jgi:uncharacterized membrane protein YedE/YeeE
MAEAIGTSLLVIALQSLAGFAGHAGHVHIDWSLTGVISAAAVAGSFAGARLARRVSPDALRRGFAWFVLAMAIFLLVEQLPAGAVTAIRETPSALLATLRSTPYLAALLGGALIGLASSILLLFNGRIAGVSGIFGGLLVPRRGDVAWRAWFLAGLLAGGAALAWAYPAAFPPGAVRSLPWIAVAGVLVGYGTRLGNGCTSGHGVCGLSRLSARSLVATVTFIGAGVITVFVANHVFVPGGPR